MDAFRGTVNQNYGLNLETYHDLWKWSVDQYPCFWETFWMFSDIIHSHPYKEVVDTTKAINEIPEWFAGSRLNYAENLLRYNGDKVALYTSGEGQQVKTITFSELKQKVATLASALRNLGIKKGDRVVGYIPNCALAIEAMLATASIGAIWSSTSPDFGVTPDFQMAHVSYAVAPSPIGQRMTHEPSENHAGVLDRFAQIKPKIIFSVNAVRYNNKIHDHLAKLSKVVQGMMEIKQCCLPQLEKVVVFPFVGSENEVETSHIPNSILLSEFLKFADDSPQLEFEQVPFNHPLFIMYSSGTTGPPKCMVHSVGGTLIQHSKEHILHGNMTKDDIIMYYTTTGWMMWNWLVSALATGASLVLYDGSPFIPNGNVLWDLVDQIGITILGTGAKWIQAIEDNNIYPKETHNLSTLHTILSTGSPLKPSSYDYVYRHIKDDVLLGSISGEPVLNISGDLVCTKPFPCMPTSFWNDPNGLKYKKAYFTKFSGVWSHGDFCSINSDTGGILMLGRSDGTLNPNGIRFGSAEIYNIVERFDEVEDSLCVGQQTKDDERVVLFLKLVNGARLNEDLVSRTRASIRSQLSARHVPAFILETKEIPYTTS
ncbi:hypothetical protein QZH41_012831, partial [Actinostola sp. cb2023]